MGLQILAGVLLCQFDVFDINDGLAGFIAFVQTIENGDTQRGTVPMTGRTGMKPVVSLIGVSGKHPVARQIQGRDVSVTNHLLLLLGQLPLRLQQLEFI